MSILPEVIGNTTLPSAQQNLDNHFSSVTLEKQNNVITESQGCVFDGTWEGKKVSIIKKKTTLVDQKEVELRSKYKYLESPYLLRIFDILLRDTEVWFITELIEGTTLYDSLHNGNEKLKEQSKFEILKCIALGIQYLHSKEIFFGKFRSYDVILYPSSDPNFTNTIKITNYWNTFSEANDVNDYEKNILWIAPEISEKKRATPSDGNDEISLEKCDIWSFSTITAEVITEKAPLEGNANEMKEDLNNYQLAKKSSTGTNRTYQEFLQLAADGLDFYPNLRPSFNEIIESFLSEENADEKPVQYYRDELSKVQVDFEQSRKKIIESYGEKIVENIPKVGGDLGNDAKLYLKYYKRKQKLEEKIHEFEEKTNEFEEKESYYQQENLKTIKNYPNPLQVQIQKIQQTQQTQTVQIQKIQETLGTLGTLGTLEMELKKLTSMLSGMEQGIADVQKKKKDDENTQLKSKKLDIPRDIPLSPKDIDHVFEEQIKSIYASSDGQYLLAHSDQSILLFKDYNSFYAVSYDEPDYDTNPSVFIAAKKWTINDLEKKLMGKRENELGDNVEYNSLPNLKNWPCISAVHCSIHKQESLKVYCAYKNKVIVLDLEEQDLKEPPKKNKNKDFEEKQDSEVRFTKKNLERDENQDLQQPLIEHTRKINAITSSQSGIVASGGVDNVIKFSGQGSRDLYHGFQHSVHSLCFNPANNSQIAAIGTDQDFKLCLKLFDIEEGKAIFTKDISDSCYPLCGGTCNVIFSDTGRFIVTSSSEDSTITAWNTDGEPFHRFNVPKSGVNKIQLYKNKLFCSSIKHEGIFVFDFYSEKIINEFHHSNASGVQIDPCHGRWMVSSGCEFFQHNLKLWVQET